MALAPTGLVVRRRAIIARGPVRAAPTKRLPIALTTSATAGYLAQ